MVVLVVLAGTTSLKSDTDYTYTVTWTDQKGITSPPATSIFSTGLLEASDWQGAEFVSATPSMLRSEFTVTGSPTRARLYILGLGYYKSYLNGEETDNHVLGPFTTFESRQQSLLRSILGLPLISPRNPNTSL